MCMEYRYFVGSTTRNNYRHAIDNCWELNGVLGSINSNQEMNEANATCIKESPSDKGCWFGLNYMNDYWMYMDGTNVKGSFGFDINGNPNQSNYPWSDGQPNFGTNSKCIILARSEGHQWNDYNCEFAAAPLCVKNPTKSCGININNLKVWYKCGLNDISNNGYNATNINGAINKDNNDCSVYGDMETSFVIPYNINATSHTIIYVAKYIGNNRQRLLTSFNDSNNNIGICYQIHSNNDLIIISSNPNNCRVHRANVDSIDSLTENIYPGTFNIGMNILHNNVSDWKLYELMIYDTILSEYQITCIEEYLVNEHSMYTILPIFTNSPTSSNNTNISSTQTPSFNPSITPSMIPSLIPSLTPSLIPSYMPTLIPSLIRSSVIPTFTPSTARSQKPPKASMKKQLNTITLIIIISIITCLCILLVIYLLMYYCRKRSKTLQPDKMASFEHNTDEIITNSNTQIANDELIAHELDSNLTDIHQVTQGQISIHEFTTPNPETNINITNNNESIPNNNTQINNDEMIAHELDSNLTDIHQVTQGQININEFVTPKQESINNINHNNNKEIEGEIHTQPQLTIE